jgi:myo-inositol 2-dehydrogenase/D-chiro-inositol 1-dehydrogenase
MDAGEIGDPEMLVVTSRDPGRAAGRVPEALGRHLQGHADPRLRHLPLDPRRRGGERLRDRELPHRPGRGERRRRRRDGSDDPHEEGPPRADQHDPPRRLRLRPALRGARREGHAAGGNHRPTEVVASTAESVSADKPEHFFLERYRAAYALEMAHFFGRLQDGGPFRTTIDDGVAAQKLADAAAQSLESGAVVRL